MKDGVIEQLRAARKVATPLVCITTADPQATVAAIVRAYATTGKAKDKGAEPAILQHDLIRGVVALNEAGAAARVDLAPPDDGVMEAKPVILQRPDEALAAADKLPRRALLLVHNVGPLLLDPSVVQAICNLRDAYKADGRTLVMLDTQITLPAALVQDVLLLDEPLPSESAILAIIDQELTNAAATMKPAPEVPDDTTKRRAVAALTGFAAFPVEQAVAMSLLGGRLDPEDLWTRKRALINATRGLTMDQGRLTFDMLGGLDEIKRVAREICGGPEPPAVIVRIDEIEKMMGGSAGDSSGTSQDQKGVILREMEDQDWTGFIAVGPPGSGKTAITQSIGNTYGAPTLAFDLGAAKDKLVGGSEQLIRGAMKVIKAIAGKNAYFVATCNNITSGVITPDLLRRFTDGIWYFDLCTKEEKDAIWPIHLARFGHALDAIRPKDDGWTGAEIRNCCRLAYRRRCGLVEAAKSIVPVSVSSGAAIDALRQQAAGRFLSASYSGTYKHVKASAPSLPTMTTPPSFSVPGRTYGES